MDGWSIGLGAAGMAAGGLALYFRLTLDSFVVRTLNGRYPTSQVMDQKFITVGAKLDAMHEAIQQLPCKNGHVCQAGESPDVKNIRQALSHVTSELVALRAEVKRANGNSD